MCGTFIFETDKLGNNHERSLSGITQFMTLLEFGRTNNYYRSVGSQGHLMINEVRCQRVINHVATSIAKFTCSRVRKAPFAGRRKFDRARNRRRDRHATGPPHNPSRDSTPTPGSSGKSGKKHQSADHHPSRASLASSSKARFNKAFHFLHKSGW